MHSSPPSRPMPMRRPFSIYRSSCNPFKKAGSREWRRLQLCVLTLGNDALSRASSAALKIVQLWLRLLAAGRLACR